MKSKSNVDYLPVLIGVAFLIPFAILGFYAKPIADDYAGAIRLIGRNFFEAYVYEYKTWSGQYTTNTLALLAIRVVENRWIYHILPFLWITGLLSSLRFLFSAIIPGQKATLLAILCVTSFPGSATALSEAIYWYSGAAVYTLGMILFSLGLGCILRFQKTESSFSLLLGLCFVLASAGTVEVLTMLVGLVAFFFKIGKYKGSNYLLLVFVAASTAFYLSPGLSLRASLFPDSGKWVYSAGMSAVQIVRFTFLTMAYIPLWVGMSWLIREDMCFKLPGIIIRSFPILLVLPMFFSAFVPYMAIGMLGQHRTIHLGQFFLILVLVILPLYMSCVFPKNLNWLRSNFLRVPSAIFAIIAFGEYVFTGNSAQIIPEWNIIQKNAEKLRIRERSISAANADTIIHFETLDTNWLLVIDLSPNPDHWINKHQATILNPRRNVQFAKSLL